jgi:hypothetical protein
MKDETIETVPEPVVEEVQPEAPPAPPPPRYVIPGARRKPRADLSRSMLWVYGAPKIGKTTLAASFPGSMFIATEKGQDWVSVREPIHITSWNHFLDFCSWLNGELPTHFTDGEPIRTLVIDVMDILFKMCNEQVCLDMGVQDPGEIPHGGGWSRLTKEFERVMNKVRQWPYGLICISHARQRDFQMKGRKTDRWEPDVGAACSRWCSGAADLIMFAHSVEVPILNPQTGQVTGEIKEERRLLVHPQSWAVAGGRMSDRIPETHIPLSYQSILKYFPDMPSEKEITES